MRDVKRISSAWKIASTHNDFYSNENSSYDNKRNIIKIKNNLDRDAKIIQNHLKEKTASGFLPKECGDCKCIVHHEIAHGITSFYKEEKQPDYVKKNISGYAEDGYNRLAFDKRSPELIAACITNPEKHGALYTSKKLMPKEENFNEIFSEAYSNYKMLEEKGRIKEILNDKVMPRMHGVLNKMKRRK